MGKIKNQLAERNLDDGVIKRQMAIIDSMTPRERKHPDILKASRKKRIAAGSGTKVEEVNRLLKMQRTMADVMKAMGGGKARGPMAGLAQMMGFGGGMPSPADMAKLAENMPGGLPGAGLPGAGGLPPNLPGLPGLPRLPGGPSFPGLPGLGGGKLPTPGGLPPNFPGFGKKK
jgi:signal recognition particle subunit SRP54